MPAGPSTSPSDFREELLSGTRIFLAIPAKQKERTPPFYLRCIEALAYPRSGITLYVRTNNNTDRTREILGAWLDCVGSSCAAVEFDATDVETPVERYGVHEWNGLRFRVLGHIRQVSLEKARAAGSDCYCMVDVDNGLCPSTLRDLVGLGLPIVGPLLRHENPDNPYSKYHHEIGANGYFANSEQYYWLLQQRTRGINEVKVIHCT